MRNVSQYHDCAHTCNMLTSPFCQITSPRGGRGLRFASADGVAAVACGDSNSENAASCSGRHVQRANVIRTTAAQQLIQRGRGRRVAARGGERTAARGGGPRGGEGRAAARGRRIRGELQLSVISLM